MPEVQLYVWENVFCDYYCGIAFAIAGSVDHAIELVMEQMTRDGFCASSRRERQLRETEPDVYRVDSPIGFGIPGGG